MKEKKEKMKRIILEPCCDLEGNQFRITQGLNQDPRLLSDLRELLRLLVFNLPRTRTTERDGIEAKSFIEQLRDGQDEKGYLKLEDGTYRWLKEKVKAFACGMYGVSGINIIEAMEKLFVPKGK